MQWEKHWFWEEIKARNVQFVSLTQETRDYHPGATTMRRTLHLKQYSCNSISVVGDLHWNKMCSWALVIIECLFAHWKGKIESLENCEKWGQSWFCMHKATLFIMQLCLFFWLLFTISFQFVNVMFFLANCDVNENFKFIMLWLEAFYETFFYELFSSKIAWVHTHVVKDQLCSKGYAVG